jgi:hypothetical protein
LAGSGWERSRRARWFRVAGPVLFPAVISLAICIPRACPTLTLLGDSPELVTAAAVGGVAHAPGFPLYTLLLGLLAKLPIHQFAWLANVSSAILHGLAVAVVGIALGGLTGSRLATAAGALILALATTFALGSLYAEVFPLNDLFFASALCLALRARRLETIGTCAHTTLASLALVAGLASANQQTIVLAAPALAVLVTSPVARVLRAHPRRLVLYLALFLTPFLGCYAALWRAASHNPPLSWGDVHDIASLWRLFTRADYWEHVHRMPAAGGWQGLGHRIGLFAGLILASVGIVVSTVAALGLVAHWHRDRVEAIALGLAFVVTGPLFALVWPLSTTTALTALAPRFVSMPLIPVAILAGCGIAAAERWLLRTVPRARWLPSLASGCAVLPLVPPVLAQDMSRDLRGIALGHDLINQTPDGSLILITGDLYVQVAEYVCAVEKACGHRVVLEPGSFFLPWRLAELQRRYPEIARELPAHPGLATVHVLVAAEIGRRPVYVMPDFLRADPALANYRVTPDLLLIRLYPDAKADFDDRARIAGRARSMAEDRHCEGCPLYSASGEFHPAEEAVVKLAYAAAYANEAQVARTVLADDTLSEALAVRSRSIASAPP